MRIKHCLSTYGRILPVQKTVDLPASSGTPAEIEIANTDYVADVSVYVANDFYWTIADSAANGASRLGSDDTRCLWPAGFFSFPVVGREDNLYIKNSVDSAVTDGISYTFVESTGEAV